MCLNVDSKSYVKFLRQYCFSFQTQLLIVSTVFCKHVEKLSIFFKKLFQDLHILWAMSIGFLKTQYCLAGCSDWSTVYFRMCVQLKATRCFSTSFLLKAQWDKTLKTKQKKKWNGNLKIKFISHFSYYIKICSQNCLYWLYF